MDREEMKRRTKRFALQVIELVESLPRGRATEVLGRQLLKSGTSVGANYRASCRAKSRPDFISKMTIVEEEADETIYWLELLAEAGIVKLDIIQPLLREADELLAITISSIRTAKQNRK
jgi:four helix bundle protein